MARFPWLARVGAVWLALSLAACDSGNGPNITTAAPPPPAASAPSVKKDVGLVMKTLTNPFFVEMEKGARRAGRDLGVNLLVRTAAQETSIEQQIQIVEDLTAAKVSAIVIAPGDSQRLVPALKKAADAGIVIVNIDNRLDEAAVQQAGLKPVPFISVDNAAGAYKAAKYLVDGVTQPTEAVILEGIRSADNAQQRLAGARKAFAENPKVKLVATETANWQIDEAYMVTQALLDKHPKMGLLFAANDMMALGAIKSLRDAGRTQVKVAGYDALAEALVEIQAGHMVATVDQQAAEQGYQGVALAVRMMRGEPVPSVTTIDTRLVTAPSQP